MKKILILFISTALLFACQRGEKTATGRPVVALVMKTLNNPFFIDMQAGAEEAAEQLQFKLIAQAPERELDVEKQMQIIENLIQRKVDAICVAPSGSREIVPAIVKANEAGIPVLVVDTRVDSVSLQQAGGFVTTFIGSDNIDGGRLAGRFISEKLNGKGKIAILEGIPGHETGDARLTGFHQAIADYPQIEIVASQTANWERDQGYNVFQNILQSHPEVQAVFACNDMMALGAIEAISASGKTGRVMVVGFDAITDARDAIASGTMAASIAQNPREMGRLAMVYAHKAIQKDTIPPTIPVKIELVRP
ncbi:sugar ABC transporter substrate-binding protein [candidate division KSB1 bacterium]|nr:sugar ABC transporter substrate-binding protein [candidate division KSB1 bacterium]